MANYFIYQKSDGVIVNSVEWDGSDPWSPPVDCDLVLVGESNAGIGWIWDGENFVCPPELTPPSTEDPPMELP